MNELNSKFKSRGLVVIGVSDESEAKVAPFITKNNMEYIVAIGGADAYKTRGIPAAWLVGADGVVLWQGHPGNLKESVIEESLNQVLSERPFSTQ